MNAPVSRRQHWADVMKAGSIGAVSISSIAVLLYTLGTAPAFATGMPSQPDARADAVPAPSVECGPASSRLCSESALFKQLPELMTTPETSKAKLPPADSSPYRELEVLPHPMIVPQPPPNVDDILLERHPGHLG